MLVIVDVQLLCYEFVFICCQVLLMCDCVMWNDFWRTLRVAVVCSVARCGMAHYSFDVCAWMLMCCLLVWGCVAICATMIICVSCCPLRLGV